MLLSFLFHETYLKHISTSDRIRLWARSQKFAFGGGGGAVSKTGDNIKHLDPDFGRPLLRFGRFF